MCLPLSVRMLSLVSSRCRHLPTSFPTGVAVDLPGIKGTKPYPGHGEGGPPMTSCGQRRGVVLFGRRDKLQRFQQPTYPVLGMYRVRSLTKRRRRGKLWLSKSADCGASAAMGVRQTGCEREGAEEMTHRQRKESGERVEQRL